MEPEVGGATHCHLWSLVKAQHTLACVVCLGFWERAELSGQGWGLVTGELGRWEETGSTRDMSAPGGDVTRPEPSHGSLRAPGAWCRARAKRPWDCAWGTVPMEEQVPSNRITPDVGSGGQALQGGVAE